MHGNSIELNLHDDGLSMGLSFIKNVIALITHCFVDCNAESTQVTETLLFYCVYMYTVLYLANDLKWVGHHAYMYKILLLAVVYL